ncbi:MAG: response regulator [Deltaproteobacteria bacterium]|nr:response regulator [Deltaproteobacteria bacterium]
MGGLANTICNVLVVDDDETVLGSWKRMIERARERERTVVTAKDAATALELVSRQPPDLAIIDLRLDNSSGIELIRQLKRERPTTLIVLCSGYLSVTTAIAGVRAGADVVAFKPITFNEILHKLEHHDDDTELEEAPTLARAEWEYITRILADCKGNISMAARRLGIYRSSLQRKLRKHAPRK